MSRITIHIGHFGSGKTEISLDKAMRLASQGEKVSLVDLDNVNPYFRSGEKRPELEALGIEVHTPTFEGSTVDVPSLPATIQRVFAQKDRRVIFDAGGDPAGWRRTIRRCFAWSIRCAPGRQQWMISFG